jgi:hypothetical protein
VNGASLVISALLIGVIVVAVAFAVFSAPTGTRLTKSTSSTSTSSTSVSVSSYSFPYCDKGTALAVLSIVPKLIQTQAYQKAESNYSNWVLYASSAEQMTASYNGTETTFSNVEVIFYSVGGNAIPSSLCSPPYIKEFLYAYIPINSDGSYNWTSINAYSQLAPQCSTTEAIINNSTSTYGVCP